MASPSASPRMIELAAKISSSVAELQSLLSAQGLPSPSFDEDSPESLPASAGKLQDAVLDATAELHELLLEPMSAVFRFSAISNLVSIDAICRFGIADMIPAGGQISFAEIAEKTPLDEALVRRLLRHSMAMRILREPEPGMVAHTKISKFLTLPYINAWVRVGAVDGWPASAKMVDAMEKWPSSESPNETGFCLANNTTKSIYEILAEDPERAMRFAASMKSFDHFPGWAIAQVPKLYDWASLGDVRVVDVGGSQGHVAIELAKSFQGLTFLVQDMEMVVKDAQAPEELDGRVKFMAHEIFAPQPVAADVYFFRLIFHNWGDKKALEILRAQIPALKSGAMILIQDGIMPEPGQMPLWRERDIRAVDMNMGCFFNSHERHMDEWKTLLAKADKRFVLKRVIEPERSLLAFLEIVWDAPSAKS